MFTAFIRRSRVAILVLAVLPLTGCLFRSRKVEQPVVGPLKTATQQELIAYVNTEAAKVQSMQATVDIDTNVGGVKKGKVVEYQQIRGYVMLRNPAMLRMIGLAPLVRNTIFDMVSDGKDFKLYLPTKGRFMVGRNDAPSTDARQSLENLRPQHIYDALLVLAIDPQNEIAVLENETQIVSDTKGHKIEQADYVLDVIHKAGNGWVLTRKIVFSRGDLLPRRQVLYDDRGEIATIASYRDYRVTDGVNFPWQIEIARPQEEYDITLTMVKLQINQPLPNEKFVLGQPAGVEVVHLGKQGNGTSSDPLNNNR